MSTSEIDLHVQRQILSPDGVTHVHENMTPLFTDGCYNYLQFMISSYSTASEIQITIPMSIGLLWDKLSF